MFFSGFQKFSLLLVVFILVVVPQIDSRGTQEDACEVLCGYEMADNVYSRPSVSPRSEHGGGCSQIGGWCTTRNMCSSHQTFIQGFCDPGQGCCIASPN